MTTSELSQEAAELKDQGNRCFADKAYEQALDFYSRALSLAPSNPVLLSNLAATHLGLKQWQAALDAANKCIAADPGFVKAYGRKAAAQMGLIRPGDAERTLLAGLSRDPGNAFLTSELNKLREEDDGDQRPVRAMDGSDMPIRNMQHRTGVDMSPLSRWPNDTFIAAYIGDEESFAKGFQPSDLRLRALEARLPLISVVVSGAQRTRGPNADPSGKFGSDAERGSRHSGVLRRLLEAGARVDGRDAAGWTALHHATAHHVVLDLAKMLIEAGADVNARDRFGTYPLVSAVMSTEIKSIKLLLAHGADPGQRDNDGVDALTVGRYNSEIYALLHQAKYNNIRPGAERRCGSCGKTGAKKGCSGCSAGVYYCDRACQVAHWPSHKAQCKRPASASSTTPAAGSSADKPGSTSSASASLPREVRVRIIDDNPSATIVNLQANLTPLMASITGTAPPKARQVDPRTSEIPLEASRTARQLAAAAGKATKEAAVRVKIQVPQLQGERERQELRRLGQNPDALLCYNQDRSLMCQLDGSCPAGRQLAELIRREGIQKLKGYFAAYFDEKCERQNGVPREMVVVTSMLPAQPF
ncbi:hypothetical protein Agub_g2767 [Astrephomene gubernaculifera]|uniref:MYND-type domain-containing protein n=1 Tax=Astrephomene gubernaculifera TaxID=47775 RepID=A0AAD3DK86_9CHLO|nr:hypothetical protein Agub_g2767 [Astrephomene gubernaculifera]